MVLLLIAFPCLTVLRRFSRGILLLFAALLAGVFSCVLFLLPRLVLLLGRDGTMTGRTDIWRAVMQAIMKHPLVGYGFSAFWLSLRGESANIILALRWAVPAAHNGFLDVWLQLGAAGLSLFLAGFVSALWSACKALYQPSFSRAAWPLAILLLTLLYNLDESSLMQPNDLLWILYVATVVNLTSPINQSLVRPMRGSGTVRILARAG
jgi:O-antigen ligase